MKNSNESIPNSIVFVYKVIIEKELTLLILTNFLILEPEWTTWSSTKCSATCGAGTIIRTRKCEDLNSGKELDKFFDCGATEEGDFKQTRKCNNKDKPCAGKYQS